MNDVALAPKIEIEYGPGRPKAYLLKDGTKVDSVTTILGRFKESGGLLQWAFQVGKSGASSLYEKRDEAGDVGSHIHEMVKADIHGKSIPDFPLYFSPEQERQAESGFYAWLRWRQDRKLQVVATEMPFVSAQIVEQLRESVSDNLLQLAAYGVLWEENRPDSPITGGYHLARFSKQNGDFSHHYWSSLNEAAEEFVLLARAYALDKLVKKRTG